MRFNRVLRTLSESTIVSVTMPPWTPKCEVSRVKWKTLSPRPNTPWQREEWHKYTRRTMNIQLREGKDLTFGAEAFNLLNRPNFAVDQ
jgi:hypothetical protein